MLKHNLLITYRNIRKFKSTFLINLIGLSTGLACVLLIYLWINDELSVDKFNTKDARLYQVMANHSNTNGVLTIENTPDLLADALASEMPEVENAVPVMKMKVIGKSVISINNKNIKADGQFAGKDFFKIFSYKLLNGDYRQVLSDKQSIVISKETAMKLFNTTENIYGKSLEWQLFGINESFIISGVFDPSTVNSSDKFDFILPFEVWLDISKKLGRPVFWGNNAPGTYVVLKEGSNIEQFNKKIAGFIKKKMPGANVTLFTRKYSDGYLYGKYENGKQTGGRIEYVRIFSIMAIFILIIACINFMNLATAKAGGRFKEVGVKKSLGAGRGSLIFQFIVESTTISVLSLISAVIIVELFLTKFNDITGKNIVLNFNSVVIPVFVAIALFTGLLSGSYPALYISRFNPVNIFKRKNDNSGFEIFARKGLVVFQFVLSIILITSVMVISQQVKFIQSKNPGYEKDNIIYLDKDGKAMSNPEGFLTEIKKIPGVVNASTIGSTMVGSQSNTGGVFWEGKNPDEVIYFEEISVGYDMLETLGFNLKDGRFFSKDFGDEKSKIIFNEAAIKAMGLKNPLGKVVKHYSGTKEIIGVVKDFNFESMHEVVKPVLFRFLPEQTTKFMIRLKAGDKSETINRLQTFYEKFNPGYSFDFKFLDEEYQSQYESEKRIEILSKYFAALAIIISCLGLFGLIAFSAEKRTKEIGIRKVLGANTNRIVFLLTKDFIKLILISFIIACPAAWFITKNWLQGFAYRIDLSVWYFVIAGLTTLMIVLAVISSQAIKAATANPVESLKYE